MDKESLIPKEKEFSNKLHEFLKEMVKTLSIGTLNPFIDFILPSFHQKQVEKWYHNVYTALLELEENKLSLETLRDNSEFISILKEAILIASKTHQIEKLEFLKNIVINSIETNLSFDTKYIYTKLLDRLSLSHMIVFSILFENANEFKEITKYTRIYKLLRTLRPDLKISREEAVFILKELELNGLIKLSENIVDINIVRESSSFVTGEENKELPYLAITGFGNGFYDFIISN